jgi:hypothetical protein
METVCTDNGWATTIATAIPRRILAHFQRHATSYNITAWSRQPVDLLQFFQLLSRRLNISPTMTLYVGIANALAEDDRHPGNAPLVRSSFCPAFARHLGLDSRG